MSQNEKKVSTRTAFVLLALSLLTRKLSVLVPRDLNGGNKSGKTAVTFWLVKLFGLRPKDIRNGPVSKPVKSNT